jgi:hypothetical protein
VHQQPEQATSARLAMEMRYYISMVRSRGDVGASSRQQQQRSPIASPFDTYRTYTIDTTVLHVLLDIQRNCLHQRERVSRLQSTGTTTNDLPSDQPSLSTCPTTLPITLSPNENGSRNSPRQSFKPISPSPTHQKASSAARIQSGAMTSTTSSARYPHQTTTRNPGHEDNYAVQKEPHCHSTTTRPNSNTKAQIDWSTAPVRRICHSLTTALLMAWWRDLGLWLLLLCFWALLHRWSGYLVCDSSHVDRRDAFAVFRGRDRRLKMLWKVWKASLSQWHASRKSEMILSCVCGLPCQK